MEEASSEAQFACPSHVYRLSHDDDQRTRLLKEVLRSTAALQEQESKGKSRNRSLLSMGEPPAAARSILPKRIAPAAISLQELAECQQRDEECLAAAGAAADGGDLSPASPLLRGCGQRIAALCHRLEGAEATLSRAQSETKLAAATDAGPEGEIRITERPDEPAAVVRARHDRVVYDFVSRHATFDKLESFKDTVDKAENYAGLRQIFPRRHHYHPSMLYLNDDVLKDPAKLKAAIWAPRPADRTSADTQKARLQSRAAVGLRVNANTSNSTLAQRRANRNLRKDRSAPIL